LIEDRVQPTSRQEAVTTSRRSLLVFTGALFVTLTFVLPAASRLAQTGRIVFESNRTGNSDIWIANADGTNQQNLTKGSSVDDTSPALAPNGKLIVFARARGERLELWLMNTDGSAKRRLGIAKGSETHPVWSPASNRIAFVRLFRGRWDVVVTNLTGTRRPLTNDAAAQYDVSWSRTGDRIVFDQLEKGGSDLWTVRPTGGRPTRVTNTPAVAELNPASSPVADEIAYDAADEKGVYDLYVLNLRTNKTRRVTDDVADDGDPAWAPSGKMLAYRRGVGDDYEVATIDTTGHGSPSNVSRDPNALDLSPSWQASTSAFRAPAAVRRAATDPIWNFFCDKKYVGTAGDDNPMTGTPAVNHMCGKAGDDWIYGCGTPAGYADFERGDADNDRLYGWMHSTGNCDTSNSDHVDWLKTRTGSTSSNDKDYAYGGAGTDHALVDANDVAYVEDVQT